MSTLSDWYRRAAVRIPEVARPHRYGHDGSGGTVDWFPDTDVCFPLRLIDRSPSVESDGHQGRRSCTVIAIPESLAAMAPFLRQSLMALLTLLPMGVLQLNAALEKGYWYARSAEFTNTAIFAGPRSGRWR